MTITVALIFTLVFMEGNPVLTGARVRKFPCQLELTATIKVAVRS